MIVTTDYSGHETVNAKMFVREWGGKGVLLNSLQLCRWNLNLLPLCPWLHL